MTAPLNPPPNFDPVARPYRWLEYLTFGPALQCCRCHFLPQLAACRRALVLGDGDGRFLARLFAANPNLRADAVDTSAAMLQLLTTRCVSARWRLRTCRHSALEHVPAPTTDLIVTHFFLDCLTQPQLDRLAQHLAQSICPGALWLVSDFRIPTGPLQWPARALVRSLYLAFRLLTGLRITSLPDHASALTAAGFTRVAQHLSLAGMLVTELWQRAR